MSPINRRTALGIAGAAITAAAGIGIPFVSGLTGARSTGKLLPSRTPIPPAFRRRLTIPPVLRPSRSDTTTDYYDITQTVARAGILPGPATELWTYNGSFPGPTIRSTRGRTVKVRYTNNLPVPTVVHLHGGRTPPDSDGYPIDYVYPTDMSYYALHHNPQQMTSDHGRMTMTGGDTREGRRTHVFPLDQRAATLWYHDHRMDFTGPSVWRGLAGFHLHHDAEEASLRLPDGDLDLPLMITDRSLDSDGSLLYPSLDPTLVNRPGVRGDHVAGVLGDVMLVNGTPWPVMTARRGTYRLRFLNACNARRLSLRLDPPPPNGIAQIGTDAGLLAEPVRHDHLELAPAQRLDVLIDFSGYAPGTRITLVNDFDTTAMGQVMRFVVDDGRPEPFKIPSRLSTTPPLRPEDAVVTRKFDFRAGDVDDHDGWLVSHAPFSPDTIAARVRLGTTEIWQLNADFHHPVHLHLSPFQVIARGSEGPGPYDAGWKDTIDLRPGEQAKILIHFDGYPGKYVFHCHNLEHEDMAMMANFIAT
ncbi:multicopper oxidase family protein [Paractinoplanes globisporus]|uniref:Multicopper oxidase CueO n=1 Tax=Paractinoplanes globisporus TaxID=113565 RepID=A0ABW6WLL1_9ACTN|nr:multicopper oxidase domain-containing protein [Actinoplanes globisporus]